MRLWLEWLFISKLWHFNDEAVTGINWACPNKQYPWYYTHILRLYVVLAAPLSQLFLRKHASWCSSHWRSTLEWRERSREHRAGAVLSCCWQCLHSLLHAWFDPLALLTIRFQLTCTLGRTQWGLKYMGLYCSCERPEVSCWVQALPWWWKAFGNWTNGKISLCFDLLPYFPS